ncbi:MAG: YidC/Oxa1 family membrane protein insertase [Candidatus Dojkabacteria bacterium]
MFNFLIIQPLTNFILVFYQILCENFGLAIIFFTIFLRIVLLPLTIRQIRLQKKMAELQPKLQEIQSRHKDGSQMSMEEMALMRQTAGSCISGLLPFVIQIPILLGLNQVINTIASASSGDIFNDTVYFDFLKHETDYRFNTQFLGFDLANTPADVGFTSTFLPYALLILLLMLTQFIQGKFMNFYQQRRKEKQKETNKPKANKKKLTKKDEEKQKMQEDMQKMIRMQTTYLIPVTIGIASYNFSSALGLYWLTQNIFAITQMYIQYNIFDEGKKIQHLFKPRKQNDTDTRTTKKSNTKQKKAKGNLDK